MRVSSFLVLASLALATTGCPTDGGPGPLLTNGDEMPSREADVTWEANLEDGEIIDLDWASGGGFGCWPGTEDTNFTGSHVFENESLSANAGNLFVRVNPANPTVDVSLYALKVGPDSTAFPPDLPSAVACDSSFDRENNSNPGVSEATTVLGGSNPYRVIIGVAGANDATSGGYDVEIWYGE